MQLNYYASEAARTAIGRIGRTEDVQFSPRGDRFAVVGFNDNRVLILSIEVNWTSEPPTIALTDPLEIDSDDLRNPHGICWLDERTVAVANRKGRLTIFEVPEQASAGRIRLTPMRILGDETTELLKTPGSVAATPVGLDLIELLVCNNFVQNVSRLLVDRRDGYRAVASEILVRDALDVPDGVATSPAGDWIAISNHGHDNVLLFRNDRELGIGSKADGVLKGVGYPHGVRFSGDGRKILVADAGAPYVLVYASDSDWGGEFHPQSSIRVVDEPTFQRGHMRPDEGGPKGIDISRDGKLMVVSLEQQPLGFFDMRPLLDSGYLSPSTDEAEAAREVMMRYFGREREHLEEALTSERKAAEFEIALLKDSRSWRFTAPLRRTMDTVRKVTPAWLRHIQ